MTTGTTTKLRNEHTKTVATNESGLNAATLLATRRAVTVRVETVLLVLSLLEAEAAIRVQDYAKLLRFVTASLPLRALRNPLVAMREPSLSAQGLAGLLNNAISRAFLIRAGNATAPVTVAARTARYAVSLLESACLIRRAQMTNALKTTRNVGILPPVALQGSNARVMAYRTCTTVSQYRPTKRLAPLYLGMI